MRLARRGGAPPDQLTYDFGGGDGGWRFRISLAWPVYQGIVRAARRRPDFPIEEVVDELMSLGCLFHEHRAAGNELGFFNIYTRAFLLNRIWAEGQRVIDRRPRWGTKRPWWQRLWSPALEPWAVGMASSHYVLCILRMKAAHGLAVERVARDFADEGRDDSERMRMALSWLLKLGAWQDDLSAEGWRLRVRPAGEWRLPVR